jgi:hypothetical protein
LRNNMAKIELNVRAKRPEAVDWIKLDSWEELREAVHEGWVCRHYMSAEYVRSVDATIVREETAWKSYFTDPARVVERSTKHKWYIYRPFVSGKSLLLAAGSNIEDVKSQVEAPDEWVGGTGYNIVKRNFDVFPAF